MVLHKHIASTVNETPVKTTITLKDETHEYLIEKFGRRKIPEAVNQALMKQLFKPRQKHVWSRSLVHKKNKTYRRKP
jgi:hypothetical protein